MKQIHNILSDAFVIAALIESEYDIKITNELTRRVYISIYKRDTNQCLEFNVLHDPDGYIRSINVSQNTLLQTNEYPYSAFINAIYNEEYMYV